MNTLLRRLEVTGLFLLLVTRSSSKDRRDAALNQLSHGVDLGNIFRAIAMQEKFATLITIALRGR